MKRKRAEIPKFLTFDSNSTSDMKYEYEISDVLKTLRKFYPSLALVHGGRGLGIAAVHEIEVYFRQMTHSLKRYRATSG